MANGDPSSQHIEFLGQKLPTNRWSALIIFIMVTGFVVVSLKSGDPIGYAQAIANSITGKKYYKDGKVQKEIEAKIYKFWTPSTNTFEELQKSGREIPNKKRRWYKLDKGNETLKEFGAALMNKKVQGYTRVKGWGEGTQGLKPGWTWTIAVPRTVNFNIEDLTFLYAKYFHRDSDIYIESYSQGETLY